MVIFERVVSKIHNLLNQAEIDSGCVMPQPEIQFDLRGQSAGLVRFQKEHPPLIRFNPLLLSENQDTFLAQTVPHEVAHIVARTLFGAKIRPHGKEWKNVMVQLGAKSHRCHNFDTHNIRVRQLRLFNYQCGCRSHQLTSIRHNRVIQGHRYYCLRCKQVLQKNRCRK